jgi:tight adherence protein B
MQNVPIFFLVAVAIGGVAWVFLYPILSGEKKAEQRKQSVVRAESAAPAARSARTPQKPRREQIEATIKQAEDRRAKSASLNVRIAQAGLSWSKQRFFITCAALGVIGLLIGLFLDGGLIAALGLGFAAGCGLPVWMLKYLKKRREAKFLNAFPDAVDIIVRGVKAGLPLLESMRMITSEAPEPLKSSAQSSKRRLSAFHSGRRAESFTSTSRCRKRISSPLSSAFNRRLAATCRKHSVTSPACCATERR